MSFKVMKNKLNIKLLVILTSLMVVSIGGLALTTDNETTKIESSYYKGRPLLAWNTTDNGNISNLPQPGIPFEVPTNGTPVSLIPAEELILVTPSGIGINLTVGEGVTISINESTINPAGPLPSNATGLNIFLEIELNDTDVEFNATLSLDYDPDELPDNVSEEALFFAFYNASTGTWQGIPSWVDTTTHQIYANTTHFSTWTILGETQVPVTPIDTPQPGVPFEIPTDGTPVSLIPGEQLILTTPSGISINLTVSKSVEISITELTTNPVGALPTTSIDIGVFVQIELNDTSVTVDAILSIEYQPDKLPLNYPEDKLYLTFYNTETNQWEKVASHVDTVNHVVYAEVTHFSTWTISGDQTTEGESTAGFQLLPFWFSIIFLVMVVKVLYKRK